MFTDLPLSPCLFLTYCSKTHTDTLNLSLFLSITVLQTDYYYEYTECDSTGSRWRVAIPQSHGSCIGLPEPVRGTECSKYCVCVSEMFLTPSYQLVGISSSIPQRPDWLFVSAPVIAQGRAGFMLEQ